jgi:hypothetical protein
MANAEEKTRKARNLIIATVALGVICIIFITVYRVVLAKSSANGYQ